MLSARRLARSICWLGLFAAPVSLASDAQEWLERMSKSATEHSFRGAFIYERTGSFSTHYVWRDQADGVMTERFLQTDGPVQEWVRRDGELICAGGTQTASSMQVNGLPLDQAHDIERWYALEVLGSTRVAARPATVLALRPRDAHRYAFEYYLDEETGLLLKSLLINERQALLERFQFATFELGGIDAAQVAPQTECVDTPSVSVELLRNSPWQPAWVPPGFAVGEQTTRLVGEGGTRLLSHVYSDGISGFTLFVEPLLDPDAADTLRAQMGPTVAVSRRLQLDDQAYLATVVGEIPPATAERIVASLLVEQGGTTQ
ncbi:MucB/RseB C-terminal domain-containing protein [Pseudomonas sp.]|uniref:MucB/RseB C-terminal domain-containing protein n=1 Tax=Pseudomonas sp. TaxID=306 RepID=UPI00272B9530|nr:MucB/RseB C-terminal domain-containing protein [Pseudomonas sp.]